MTLFAPQPARSNLTSEQINDRAAELARQFADGVADQCTANGTLAAMLRCSDLPHQAGRWYAGRQRLGAQELIDAQERAVDVTVDRLLDGGFDMRRMLQEGTSFTGWAVKFMTGVMSRAAYADVKARKVITTDFADERLHPTWEARHEPDPLDDLSGPNADDAEAGLEAVTRRVSAATANTRQLQRDHLSRRVLFETMQWQEPEHIDDPQEAARIAELARNQANLVLAANRLIGGNHVDGAPYPLQSDAALQRLLAPLSRHDLLRGVRTPRCLQEYTWLATAPRPAAGRQAVKKAASRLAAKRPGNQRWALVARNAVTAAADWLSDRPSEFTTADNRSELKDAATKEAERCAWLLAAGAAADFEGAPIGTDPDDMLRAIRNHIEDLPKVDADPLDCYSG